MLSGARGNNSTSGRLTSDGRLRASAPCVARLFRNAPKLFATSVLTTDDHQPAPMASGVEHWGCVGRVRTSHRGSFFAWPAGWRRTWRSGRGQNSERGEKRYERQKGTNTTRTPRSHYPNTTVTRPSHHGRTTVNLPTQLWSGMWGWNMSCDPRYGSEDGLNKRPKKRNPGAGNTEGPNLKVG